MNVEYIQSQIDVNSYREQVEKLEKCKKPIEINKIDEAYNCLLENGYNVEKMKCGSQDLIVFRDNINTNSQKKFIYCRNLDEFREYVDVKYPTFEDVRNAISENNKIPDKYKNILSAELYKLQKEHPNIDLVALYYNLTNLEIVVLDEEQLRNNLSEWENVRAYFSPEECKAYIKENATETTMLHEAFYHPIKEAAIKKDNITIRTSSTMCILKEAGISNGQENFNLKKYELGHIFEEARAACMDEDYEQYEEEIRLLKILLKIAHVDIEYYTENGLEGLIRKLDEKNFDIIYRIIDYADLLLVSKIKNDYVDGLTYKELENITAIYYINHSREKGETIELALKRIMNSGNQADLYTEIISSAKQKGIGEAELGLDIIC